MKQGMMVRMDSALLGEAKPFNINDCQGFVLGTDVPGTTETAPGSCKVYKKNYIKNCPNWNNLKRVKKGYSRINLF